MSIKFITGPAGSGKTYSINKIVKEYRQKGKKVIVTSTTGISANHINGTTIHRALSLGIADHPDQASKIYKKRTWSRTVSSLQDCELFIIDEISMMSGHQLDLVDKVMRKAMSNKMPFGGINLLMVGDFYQLPPVTKSTTKKFAFQSDVWKNNEIEIEYLKSNHRQKDSRFVKELGKLRLANVDDDLVQYFDDIENSSEENIFPKLVSRAFMAERINNDKLSEIKGKVRSYEMIEMGDQDICNSLKKSVLPPEILHLKKGANVIFTYNDARDRWFNGTRGVVTGFDDEDDLPIVTLDNGEEYVVEYAEYTRVEYKGKKEVGGRVAQIPLILAYALTIHKSQGMTLEEYSVDCKNMFAPGQMYVAFSRAKTPEGLHIKNFDPNLIKAIKVDL